MIIPHIFGPPSGKRISLSLCVPLRVLRLGARASLQPQLAVHSLSRRQLFSRKRGAERRKEGAAAVRKAIRQNGGGQSERRGLSPPSLGPPRVHLREWLTLHSTHGELNPLFLMSIS